MSRTTQLLQQLRRSIGNIRQSTNNADVAAVLSYADQALNELLLQESPAFYLDYIATGKALIREGGLLAASSGSAAGTLPPDTFRKELTGELNAEIIRAEIRTVHGRLVPIVKALDESRSPADKSYLEAVCGWEASLYKHSLGDGGCATQSADKLLTAETLQAYLRDKAPQWTGLRVLSFQTLYGGASKTTALFETHDDINGPQSLVLRAEPAANVLCYPGCDVTREFYMIQLMQRSGLPIAEPLWVEEDASRLGMRFIVSRKASGRVYGNTLGSNESLPSELLASFMATFVKMHKIRIDPKDELTQRSHLGEWLPYVGSLHGTIKYMVTEYLPRMIRVTDIDPSPQLIRGLNWLQSNIPECDEMPAVIHTDFAFNNLLIENNRIAAVLDWETSLLGDPSYDIIWAQYCLSKYISMPEFLRLYSAATGRVIPEYRLAYARVLKCALSGIGCRSAARVIERARGADFNLILAHLAYKYLSMFGSQFNELIADAERLKA